MQTLIKNVRVVSPDLDLPQASLVIDSGKIVEVVKTGASLPEADTVIDGEGLVAMPGFIDIHAHGADGCDTVDKKVESVAHISKRKLGEGVTTWLPTTLTLPQDHLLEAAKTVAEYMAAPEFGKTPGLHVEGPFINPKCTGAQNPDFVRLPNLQELKEIHEIAPALVVSVAPEMEGAVEFVRGAMALGVRCSAAHTAATHADVTAAKEAGLVHLTHFCNQMTPLHHREIGVVGTGLIDPDLKIEIICDTIHLCPDMLKLTFGIKPIEQMMLITDSMSGSWLPDGETQLGGLPVVIEGGVARVKESGALAGSTLRYNFGVKNVAEISGMPLSDLVKATSWNQAQSLGLEGIGRLEAGYAADVVLLDEQFEVRKTLVDGEVKFEAS